MNVQVCSDLDDTTGTCNVPLEWVAVDTLIQDAATWLSVPDALKICAAIGTLWGTAWVIRALAQQLNSQIR